MRLLLSLLAVPIASCLDAPPELATAEQTCQVQPVVGDLLVEGCTPPPGEILVTATESKATLATAQTQLPEPPSVRALVLPTQNPHHYAVVFPLLKSHVVYTVSAAMPTTHCPKVAWQGPHGGLLVAGDTALHVTGYAMRTQTEMLATRGPNHTPTWVGVDAIDLDAAGGAVRDFRWRTDVPGAVAGRVELSTERFPVEVGGQQQDPPLLASWTVPLSQQGWSTVPAVDFAAPFATPPCDAQQNPNGCATQLTPSGILNRAVHAGAPIFARVVPIDANGARLGGNTAFGIASTLQVAHTRLAVDMPPPPPPEPALLFDGLFYHPPDPERADRYNQGCYKVNTEHTLPASLFVPGDPWGTRIAADGARPWGATLPVGEWWCFSHSSGTLDDIVDSISGLVDAVGDLVNEISKLYEDIKKGVVSAVASAIDHIGIVNCEDACQAALMAGLDAALASVGLPPSLPNFDELADRGLDYLAEVAAEESGVPPYVIDEARTLAARAIQEMKSKNHLPEAPWLTPDDGFRPGDLQTFLRRSATSTDQLPGVLRFDSGSTFHGTDVFVPSNLPTDDGVLITVQLLPDFSGIEAPPCTTQRVPTGLYTSTTITTCPTAAEKQLYYERQWYARTLATPCDLLEATGFGVGHFGDGALIFTPNLGRQVDWQFRPGVEDYAGGPLAHTCL